MKSKQKAFARFASTVILALIATFANVSTGAETTSKDERKIVPPPQVANDAPSLLEIVRATAPQTIGPYVYSIAPSRRITVDYNAKKFDDNYVLLYRFKERACGASLDEILECVEAMENMTPKEKTLVLTAIVLFQHTRRESPRSLQRDFPTINLPYYAPDSTIDAQTWSDLDFVLDRYQNDRTLVFEARPSTVATNENATKKNARRQWFQNAEEYFSFLESIPYFEASPLVQSRKADLAEASRRFEEESQGETRGRLEEFDALFPYRIKLYVTLYAVLFRDFDKIMKELNASSPEKAEKTAALREYLYDSWHEDPDNSSVGPEIFWNPNGNGTPAFSLGDVVYFLRLSLPNYNE